MRRRAILSIVSWTVLFLVVLDVGLGIVFRYPGDNRTTPTELQSYFEYGRSLEGKLDRLLGADAAHVAPIAQIGWLDRDCKPAQSPTLDTGRRGGISVFGMSFSNHVAAQVAQVDPGVRVVARWGPGAAPNHSHACFRHVVDGGGDGTSVQVIGVLASTIYRALGLTGFSAAFEAPTPYTYPRYRLASDGSLVAEEPTITALEQWRAPAQRAAFFEQLAKSDVFYDRWLTSAGFADHSVLVRLARRAYAQQSLAARQKRWVGGPQGFVANGELGPVLSALLADFAARASAHGALPVVLLIQDRPGTDALYRLLGPGLERAGIPFLSTHDIVPTTDPANFVSDGHFTDAANRRIAERLLALVRSRGGLTSAQ